MERLESDSTPANATPAWVVPCLTVLILGIASLYYWHVLPEMFNEPDSAAYIKLAEGRLSEVGKPFSNRLTCPTLARFISRSTGWSLDASFFALNFAFAAVWISLGLGWIFRRTRSFALATAIVLTPVTLLYAREIYNADCVHAALTIIFFLLLARRLWWAAIPVLFLLQITNEATMLLTLVFVLVCAYHRMWKLALAGILVTGLGIGVVGHYAKQGKGNIHDQGTLVYLVGKVPFNFLTNVCGLRMWTNTHAENDPAAYPNEPMFKVDVPKWIPTGRMRQVGIYALDYLAPLRSAGVMFTIFGVMPVVALFAIVRRRWRLVRDDGLSFIALLTLVYGVLAYLLGPSLGAGYFRLTSRGWPLAWIAVPELLAHYFNLNPNNKRFIGQLVWLQVICSWPLFVLQHAGVDYAVSCFIALVVAIPCYVITWRLLRRNWTFDR
jgi:hypothetical protein